MIEYFLFSFLSLFFINTSLAQDINIQESVNLIFKCDLDKKIIKNSEYNYQTFLAKDLEDKDLDKFEINAKQPKTLLINGLSSFLSKKEKLTWIVNVAKWKAAELYCQKHNFVFKLLTEKELFSNA